MVALGLAGWLTASTYGADDIEVLARGPVHEAYATPSEREPKPSPVIPKEPPKAIEELPPDQKPAGDNIQWMPGYWSWDDDKKDFVWVSGFWRNAPADRNWVPGSWAKSADGWQWTGGFWAAANAGQDDKAQVDYLPQPPVPLDADGPSLPQPSDTDVYVPGTWVYHDRYLWQPGYWAGYQPDRVWVAANYRWTPAGYVFVDGYWDYPLADRGTLFAPAYIPAAVYADPAFVYTPSYVVQEPCLYGSLFCRRGFGSYYFGDYFSPAYASQGFSAWCGNVGISVGFGGSPWYDPLFNYYRCGHRSDPFWGGGGINDLYAGRYRGDYLRPPTTLVQQNTVINNITRNRTTVNNVNVNNVNMLSSLSQVGRSGRHNLQPVSDPARREFAQTARTGQRAAEGRAITEARLARESRTGPVASRRQSTVLPALPSRAPTTHVGPRAAAAPRPTTGHPAGLNRNPVNNPQGGPRAATVGRARPPVPTNAANRRVTPTPDPRGLRSSGTPAASRRAPIGPSTVNRGSGQAVPHQTPRPNLTAPNFNRSVPRSVTPPTRTARPPAAMPQRVRPPVARPQTRTVPTAPRTFARPATPKPAIARPAATPRPNAARPAAVKPPSRPHH